MRLPGDGLIIKQVMKMGLRFGLDVCIERRSTRYVPNQSQWNVVVCNELNDLITRCFTECVVEIHLHVIDRRIIIRNISVNKHCTRAIKHHTVSKQKQ